MTSGALGPGPAPRSVPWWAWAGVALAALLVRVAIVQLAPPQLLFRDAVDYESIGRLVHEQGTYGWLAKRAPGYPTLIAGTYALLGTDLHRLRLVESVLGTVSVAVIGAVGTSLFGPPAGIAAAAMAAFHPVLALLPSTQYSENTLVLVLVLAFAAAFAAWRRGGTWRWALAGALFGIGLLVRPNTVLMLPGVALGFALALRREGRRWLVPLLVTAVTAVLVVTPWIVRNHRVYHHWYFVATGGGGMLYAGNSPGATGAPNIPPPIDSLIGTELARQPDIMGRDRVLFAGAVRYIVAHPGRAAHLYLVKLGNLFALFPTTQSRTVYMKWWARAGQGFVTLVVFAGAVLALRRLRRTPALWPMVGGIVTFALVNSFFWTVMRYRMAIEPSLLWMAGLGWAALFTRLRVSR